MKKVTSALALAALIGSPAAFAQQVEFGGDFDARYYNGFQINDSSGERERENGFNQRIRLQSSFQSDGGVEVHTRLNLMNDRWTGDDGGGVQGTVNRPYSDQDHRNVELDYGYVSVPLAGGRLNVGRQVAAWGHGLTLTDDRRDRISYVRPVGGGHTLIVGADRRSDGGPTSPELDGNQMTLAALGPIAQDITYGFLLVQWEASGSGAGDSQLAGSTAYAARGATLVSPYIEGASGDFDYKVGGHYIGNSRATGPARAYTEDAFAGYVKSGFQLTPELKLEGQVLHAMDGAPVDQGYDTYSSLIHSSPNNDQSATRVGALDLGGAGTDYYDGTSRTLVAARATYEVMDWTFMGAAGWVNYNNDDYVDPATGVTAGVDEDVLFGDLQAHYAVTPSTTVYATAGYAQTEDFFDESGYEAKDVYATSINLSTQF